MRPHPINEPRPEAPLWLGVKTAQAKLAIGRKAMEALVASGALRTQIVGNAEGVNELQYSAADVELIAAVRRRPRLGPTVSYSVDRANAELGATWQPWLTIEQCVFLSGLPEAAIRLAVVERRLITSTVGGLRIFRKSLEKYLQKPPRARRPKASLEAFKG